MRKGYTWIVVVVVIAAVVGAVWYYSTRNATPSQTGAALSGRLKIGAALPLTGDAASYGLPLRNAIETAVDHINDKMGGVGGKKLEVVYEDDKCAGKDAANAIQKLINIDQVKWVIGGACSGATLAMAPIANSAKVVLISPSATSPDITLKGGEYVFRTSPSDAMAGKIAAEYAYNKMSAKKVAVVSESTDYAQGLRKVFSARIRALGGSVVVDETFNPGDTDFRAIVSKVKGAGPDVVYVVPQAPTAGVSFIKQYKSQGGKSKLLTAEVLAGRDVISGNASDVEGLTTVEPSVNEDLEGYKTFSDLYKAEYGEHSFPAFEAGAWDVTHLLRDGVMAVGYEGEALKNWLYTVRDRNGALGKITFDANGDNGVATYRVALAKGGKLETIEFVKGSAN